MNLPPPYGPAAIEPKDPVIQYRRCSYCGNHLPGGHVHMRYPEHSFCDYECLELWICENSSLLARELGEVADDD